MIGELVVVNVLSSPYILSKNLPVNSGLFSVTISYRFNNSPPTGNPVLGSDAKAMSSPKTSDTTILTGAGVRNVC